MPTLNQSQINALKSVKLGVQVSRPTAGLPATTATPIFNVIGGRILLLQILGEVTTIIQAQADNTKLVANPTVGSDVDMCAVLDITGIEVGGKLGITGTPANAMFKGNGGSIPAQTVPVIVNVGTIDLNCAATNTGSVKWDLFYVPLDDGAYVTVA
jgi:hypothetical protein